MSLRLVAILLILLAVTFIIVVCTLVTYNAPWPVVENQETNKKEDEETNLDSALKVLLHEPTKDDPDHTSRFFVSLLALATKNNISFKDNAQLSFMDEGYALRRRIANTFCIIAILRGNSQSIPGTDAQQLILFDKKGRMLDMLSCEINNKLTRMIIDSGQFYTDVLEGAEKDSIRLVIRYVPEKGAEVSGNWSHEITYEGKTYSFHWDQDNPDNIRSVDWESKGLCQVTIREDRFLVVFPQLTKPLRNDELDPKLLELSRVKD